MTEQEKMQQVVKEGGELMDVLYSYQNKVKDLKQYKSGGNLSKDEVCRANLAILEPQLQQMRRLFRFYRDRAKGEVVSYCKDLSSRVDSVTDAEKDALVDALDIILRVDFCKTWQPGLNNDYSMFRRNKVDDYDNDGEDEEALRMFLVMPNAINNGFRDEVSKIPNFLQLFVEIIKYCSMKYEELKEDKFLRCCAFCVFLIDPLIAQEDTFPYIKKELKLAKIAKPFDRESVQLHKELVFDAPVFMKKCPNFTEKKGGVLCIIL